MGSHEGGLGQVALRGRGDHPDADGRRSVLASEDDQDFSGPAGEEKGAGLSEGRPRLSLSALGDGGRVRGCRKREFPRSGLRRITQADAGAFRRTQKAFGQGDPRVERVVEETRVGNSQSKGRICNTSSATRISACFSKPPGKR